MDRTTSQEGASKSLLDIISSSKDEKQPSKSLMAALGGQMMEKMTEKTDKQFTLPDLVAMKEGEEMPEEERELLKPLPKPLIKPRAYPRKGFNKEKIKLGTAMQREQQKQRAEELLQQEIDIEIMQEEIDEKAQREEAKQQQAQHYERRMKEKEEKEEEEADDEPEDQIVQTEEATPVGSSKTTDVKPKNPRGRKKIEQTVPEEFEEEDVEERVEETMRKRKAGGCINLQESAEFQRFVNEKMAELVEEMRNMKNLIQLVRQLIRSLKLQYDKIHLFESNGAANTEDIVNTIMDTKEVAWRKSLERKEILDAEEYNRIVELCMESRLFQEGNLHLKLNETVFGPETDETKEIVMQKCALLFENVEKAHHTNLEVAKDLKDLANLVKEPEVFTKIAQAATQSLVACYTPQIDTFIKQQQVTMDTKQDKLSERRSIEELMEISNLPQCKEAWWDRENKDKAPTRYMAGIIWYFMKCEMCGTAPNIGNIADAFKVSRSQLSRLITAKKFKSGPAGYISKRRRPAVEGETSGGAARKTEVQDQGEDELEGYLVH